MEQNCKLSPAGVLCVCVCVCVCVLYIGGGSRAKSRAVSGVDRKPFGSGRSRLTSLTRRAPVETLQSPGFEASSLADSAITALSCKDFEPCV